MAAVDERVHLYLTAVGTVARRERPDPTGIFVPNALPTRGADSTIDLVGDCWV